MFSSFFLPASLPNNNGAPLSELSWSSSLAVVAISFSGLFTFVFLMLACLCCKKGKIGFKEFKNVDGEEYHADMSTLASPASQGSPDVYILPLTEVSLPVAKQPARSGEFSSVLLGEVNAGLNTTQVVVKELKASASVQEQMHFLEEAQPYRYTFTSFTCVCTLFCVQGDVKGYLRSCRTSETMSPEPLILQRMACDISSGLLHLHKHNFTHSDLALRNCLLTADVSVKIGDYGLAHTKYKDDYYVTSDQMYVPLRWIAPELVDEVHGNLLVADQTKHSNIWSLGVTMWELFELGNQPYRHYSDRQVLTYAVREQQLRLPKPLLKVPLAERWYEVMQFCWLQPDQRPTAEEVHLLLSYLCAKGASEAEEDFERRWNSMRPNTGFNSQRGASAMSRDHPSSTTSSFPLLEPFSNGDGYHSESGDDILTVTETSHGLNFEYKWEQARADQSYRAPDTSISPSYYQPKHLHAPGVLPVLSAHSPSVNSEYYIRIEEPVDSDIHKSDMYDSNDSSPAISLTMEPLLGQVSDNSPLRPWESSHYVSYKDRDGGYYFDHSPPLGIDHYLIGGELSREHHQESWGSRSLQMINLSPAPGGPIVAKSVDCGEQYVDLTTDDVQSKEKREDVIKEIIQKLPEPRKEEVTLTMTKATQATPPPDDNTHVMVAVTDPQSEMSHTSDSEEDITDDITDVTSGIFADESSELNASPAFKLLQKQVGTPDSMDSMDLPSAAGSCEGSSPASSHPSSSPKAMDSGYDTENNESPEFVPKEPHEPLEAKVGESSMGEDLALEASQEDDQILLPLSDKTPYRDSAYFSDYENEKQTRHEGEELQMGKTDEQNIAKEPNMAEKKAAKRKNDREEELKGVVVKKDIKLETKQTVTDKTEFSPASEIEEYLTEDCCEDETLGLPPEPSDTEGGLDEWPSQEESSSLGDWAAEVVGAMEEALGALNGDCATNVNLDKEEADDIKDSAQTSETSEEAATETVQNRPSGTSSETKHTLPKDEVALQQTSNARRFSSSSPPPPSTPPPPLPATEGRASPADGEEADEEDGDTDDSDESDEELQSYNMQEQSGGEESEEECHPVPIVVSDNSEAHKLRSLLKMPALLTEENLEEELEHKKKTVSFFDDVTVYLFDQESPTKELAEHGFPLGAEGSRTKPQERVNASDDSSDGNISEESAGFEWEDDFPLLPLPTSSAASESPPPRSVTTTPDTKPAVQYSRFTVSPSSVSRFSITHISDSDMESNINIYGVYDEFKEAGGTCMLNLHIFLD
uniref:Apoptosis-associated tyrosine kinase b n=1 Tax=Neolamprologus brichardi TaxID=32507 RepID=A0A3Q4I4Y2_NEOBR